LIGFVRAWDRTGVMEMGGNGFVWKYEWWGRCEAGRVFGRSASHCVETCKHLDLMAAKGWRERAGMGFGIGFLLRIFSASI
jgi:hypothetical protein